MIDQMIESSNAKRHRRRYKSSFNDESIMILTIIGILFLVILVLLIRFLLIPKGRLGASILGANGTTYQVPKMSFYNTNTTKFPELLSEPPADRKLPYKTLLEIVQEWNPDNPDKPSVFTEQLQHFDYSNPIERRAAEKFRDAELPFKIYNCPEVSTVTARWTDKYLLGAITGAIRPVVEKSKDNHFMYWGHIPNNKWAGVNHWKPPTDRVNMVPFSYWLKMAKHADQTKLKSDAVHYYYQTGAMKGDRGHTFIARDLKIFSTTRPNFFITKPEANKGIQCRFGMRGVIAESHFDGGRNMVAMIKGSKRYILSPPEACKYLGIITDTRHPSYRHSVIDWSDEKQAISRGFDKVPAIDTILREGEVLYIPSYWFHYIVSLQYSIQCNSRSGSPPKSEGKEQIEGCFGARFQYKN